MEKIEHKSNDLSAGDLEAAHKLTDTIKNIDKICMLGDGEGYSEAVDGDDYGCGSSYAHRGKYYVRDHYSRDDGRDDYPMRRGGYSWGNGRSEMMEYLEKAMDSATDQDRETIKRFMSQLENA